MKARTAFALVALLFLAGRTQAGGIDKAKLRGLVKLPEPDISFGIGFSTLFGLDFGEKPDPLAEIARLQKQMKGDASDAEHYLRLGRLYAKAEREEAKEAFAKAVAICRQQVREHPEDMSWLARLGEALFRGGETKEAEKLLRRAVKEAPNEWRAWLALAECVDDLALRAILGDKPISFGGVIEKMMIPALLEQRKPTREQIAEMRQLWKEARRYYDRAVELAPREAKPYFRRVASNGCHGLIEAGLRGERVNPMAAFLTPECIADVRRIARFSPNDPQVAVSVVFCEIMTCVLRGNHKRKEDNSSSTDSPTAKSRSLLDVLPAESRESVRWGMERLEQLTKNPDKATAAAASEILGIALLMIKTIGKDLGMSPPDVSKQEDTTAKTLEHLRRAVRLDPSRQRAWDVLTMLLIEKKKTDEALTVARKRIEFKDNARNRFLLATVYASGDQFEKAAEELRAGLKNDSKDLHCRLGLIALVLKRDDEQALKEVSEQFDDITPRMKEQKSKQCWLSFLLLRGIHAALNDLPDRARETFKQILRRIRGETTATRAIAALGEPLGLADQQLAIDYIAEQRGHVERADGLIASLVERIYLGGDKITDEDLFVLAAFPDLRQLDLSFAAITDDGLTHLMDLTALRSLNLDDTKITDAGLAHLHRLKQLQSVKVRGTKVTPQGIAELRKALPQLKVRH